MGAALLSEVQADQIVKACRTTTGDRLRSVTYFTRDSYDQLYLRSDLERDADLSSFIGVEWRESGITDNAYRSSELGEHTYTIRAFENGYLLRVSTEHGGVFITTDGLTMHGYEEVATALRELLESVDGSVDREG